MPEKDMQTAVSSWSSFMESPVLYAASGACALGAKTDTHAHRLLEEM